MGSSVAEEAPTAGEIVRRCAIVVGTDDKRAPGAVPGTGGPGHAPRGCAVAGAGRGKLARAKLL